jgi:vibriolysin
MKTKVMSGKILFSITLVFVVCCLMATHSWAARKIEFTSANAKGFIQKLNQNNSSNNTAIGQILGLSGAEAFKLLRQNTDFNRVTHSRYRQTYKGIPVWGMQTVIGRSPANKVFKLNGTLVLDIPGDMKGIPASLDPLSALRRMQDLHKQKDTTAEWTFRNEKYETEIYIDKNDKAHLCYVVSFFADTACGNPSNYIYFIDVHTGKTLHSFDMLNYYSQGTGPGGNLKTGYYYYGIDYPGFPVTENSGTCAMEIPGVKTVDLNHTTSGTTAYSYTCYENTHENINGGYCPMNDAQFFGQVTCDMYNNWYGVPVVLFQFTIKCHYSNNYEGAFWDGANIILGDGGTTFYPLGSLDVICHEASHGFTEYNSGLIFSSQSGGINDSFADIAGDAAEYYLRNSADFMCGYEIFKDPDRAIRYFYDPPLDGFSIDHVDDYYDGMVPQYSSGIFNKAFYLIATTPGWNFRMAFDIFVKANQDYWTPASTFAQGATGVMNGAVDYGYSCQAVVDAFAQVGINLECPGPPIADFSAFPPSGGIPLTVRFTDESQAAATWSWDFGDGGTSTLQNPTHTFTTMGNFTITLTVTNEFGSDTKEEIGYIAATAPQAPIANFTASSTDINIGNSVTFTDTSLENPASWSWTFEGGTPASSAAQNPVITYNTVGTFDVTLVATNAQGSDTETKVDYITVSEKPYCASQGNTYSMEWIARVQVGAMDNASGAAGYTDFTAIDCDLTGGSTVNVILTPGFSGSAYTEYWRIWIDYNDDHDFEDAGEEVFSGLGTAAVTGSFTVAPDITVITRMRVSMKYSAYPLPCEAFTYGEVEDYTADIIPQSCLGTLTNPGFETGTLSGWTPTGNVGITTDAHTGSYAVIVNGGGSSVGQVVVDLCSSTTYTVSCWGKAKSSAGVYLGVKNYGGVEQTVQFTDSRNFVKKSITFTTGATNTSATIFFIKLESKLNGIGDDFEIVEN